MLRIVAIALMLSPGIAHAQKFVSVGDDAGIPTITPEVNNSSDPVATDPADPATDDVATIDYSLLGDDVVFDGATVEEIEALLQGAGASSIAADEQNAIITRIDTDDDGGSVLALDVAGSDAGGSQSAAASGIDDQELGECNEGTNWVSPDINCYNAYPTANE